MMNFQICQGKVIFSMSIISVKILKYIIIKRNFVSLLWLCEKVELLGE